MKCKVTDLRSKEIVNINGGMKMGSICDIEIDTETGALLSFSVYGRQKGLGLFGREEDIVIPWNNIKVIGDDAILVDYDLRENRPSRRGKGCFESSFK